MNDTAPPVTTAEAAAMLGVSPLTVWRWIKNGKIPAVRYPGGQYRIEVAEVERIRSGEATTDPDKVS